MLSTHTNPVLLTAIAVIAQYLIAIPAALTVWAIFLRRRRRSDIIEAALAGILAIAFVKLAGALYVHARPFITYRRPPIVPHASDNAFPSDHLAACGLAVAYLWERKRTFAAFTAGCAVLIGAARVLTGLHWPIDVLAGFALGATAVAVTHRVLMLAPQTRRNGPNAG